MASSSSQPVRILVVEDNQNDQELLRRQLKKASIDEHVLCLADPRDAVELLHGPDSASFIRNLIAIFLDVHLPHMSGVELLEIIRQKEEMADFPIIVMTSCPHPEIEAACERLKVFAFVEKPLTYLDFSQLIAGLFHKTKQVGIANSEPLWAEETGATTIWLHRTTRYGPAS
jgi:CheY-like chemotaxis protein